VTVQALVAMKYPHETWVLDEGDDPDVKALCHRCGARHFSRKNRPGYQAATGTFESRSKHGNYNAWLHEIGFDRYDIITAFDPDHIPEPEFLDRVLGYFDDPEFGYVQAPQVYYNQKASFIARGAAEETYAYYSSIQMVAYALGYPIVTGCHNTHRTTALREVGGFAPHAADDLLITVLYRARGWRGVYVPEILAKGLTPVDWPGYLTQQRRWARSVVDIKLRIFPKVAGDLPLRERIMSAIHGLYYIQSVGTALQILLLVAMLATGITPAIVSVFTIRRLVLLYIAMQAGEFFRQRFYLDPRREIGIHVRASVLAFAKWPFIIAAIYDCLTRDHLPYSITRKVRMGAKRVILVLPHSLVIVAICLAWLIGKASNRIENPILQYSAAVIVAMSFFLLASEWLRYPDPFDIRLLKEEVSLPEHQTRLSD
jgi:cellulose synthase (UDP-forming)